MHFNSRVTPHGSSKVINFNAALRVIILEVYFNGLFHGLLYLHYIFKNARIKFCKVPQTALSPQSGMVRDPFPGKSVVITDAFVPNRGHI